MTQVKIISAWSKPGGSTVHHVLLTNLFNRKGLECTFYGQHSWHLNKCNGGTFNDIALSSDDILISHFIKLPPAMVQGVSQHILSCHETNLFPLGDRNLTDYSLVQYVSESQREWHGVDHPYVVIPPVVEKIEWTPPNVKRAGVIGSIDPHKQTHLSVTRALDDGFDEVYIFGEVSDQHYMNLMINPLLGKNVFHARHEDNKTKMYNTVDAVYHSSLRETFGLVKAECERAGIPYHGLPSSESGAKVLTEDEVWEEWSKCLKI